VGDSTAGWSPVAGIGKAINEGAWTFVGRSDPLAPSPPPRPESVPGAVKPVTSLTSPFTQGIEAHLLTRARVV
jgi:hypothetical protein